MGIRHPQQHLFLWEPYCKKKLLLLYCGKYFSTADGIHCCLSTELMEGMSAKQRFRQFPIIPLPSATYLCFPKSALKGWGILQRRFFSLGITENLLHSSPANR
ncbi:Hypothetical predicted protein [Podarcis lilfordi]|uniref:Uncharacterized protein n=1 Tax=Podarcis lilfordi TaxID=74358 RepID=A0AA35P051_9SAUR|nr:Hypothetical predicted protein [Podarcis lilfordi]